MPESAGRDVAVVLSGGGMSGIMLELGFLQRLRESALWERIGVIFGTSAGALAGSMAALDRLDELEAFLLRLRPEETFRAHRLWRLPLLGTHDYVLPRTIAERLGDPVETARALADSECELVVVVTDVTASPDESVVRPTVRARLLVQDDTSGGNGAGGARLCCDQCSRSPDGGR